MFWALQSLAFKSPPGDRSCLPSTHASHPFLTEPQWGPVAPSSGWLSVQGMLAPAPGISANHGGPISLLVIGEVTNTWHSGQLGPKRGGCTWIGSLTPRTQRRDGPFPAPGCDIWTPAAILQPWGELVSDKSPQCKEDQAKRNTAWALTLMDLQAFCLWTPPVP